MRAKLELHQPGAARGVQSEDFPASKSCQNPVLQTEAVLGTGGQTNSHQGLGSGRASRDRVREVIINEELPRRIKQKNENYYFLTVDSELTIDAGPKGNLARFINYSCESNCETLLWKVGGSQSVGLFALKDLKAVSFSKYR
ncbi:histone-lysine N-methyltransferase NSD2-like [Culex pipiens pallens]|uniref:histone-lysine N-methyltransferase NSD2-like n=1 Tax=Culex pipiens pallens TaxID=42434 RepID=UPI0022A9FE90|nr:histone-lysine N-methyltransferase NSD2-like [Culex pipiens pallens]